MLFLSQKNIDTEKLSNNAKKIMEYLKNIPSNWPISVEDVDLHCNCNTELTREGINELIELGYIVEKNHKTTSLLLDSQPLVVVPELIKKVGLNEAIILQEIHFWIIKNEKADINFKDGHYWAYWPISSWKWILPYYSEVVIKKAISNLKKLGILIIETEGNTKKKNLYRINYDKLMEGGI